MIWATYTQKMVRHIILITNFNMNLHTWWILCCWWRSSTIAKCAMTIEGACLFRIQKESYYISGYACIVLGLSIAIQTVILAYSFNSTSSFSLLLWWNIHPHKYELECVVSNLHDRRASCNVLFQIYDRRASCNFSPVATPSHIKTHFSLVFFVCLL